MKKEWKRRGERRQEEAPPSLDIDIIEIYLEFNLTFEKSVLYYSIVNQTKKGIEND